jgi:hypothetical protein
LFLSIAKPPAASIAIARRHGFITAILPFLSVLVFVLSASRAAQGQRYVCSDGYGSFSSDFSTGVTVTVGAAKNGAFATHACDASLRWGKNVMRAVDGAYLVDIDVLGADLGLGVPVVAFQVKTAESDKQMSYRIYSLEKPPRLLRTITGGDVYKARDRYLEGRSEIWTDDAGAVSGFENLPLTSFDFLPTVALRFEKNRLIDVSPEFQPYFDEQIAQVKAQLSPEALNDFKNTDGELAVLSPRLLGNLHALLMTKIAVLEIVWSYLYSGREQQAWTALADMWPASDLDRIRTAILNTRAHGILSQVDGTAKPGVRPPSEDVAAIYRMKEKQVRIPSSGNLATMISQAAENSNGVEDRSPVADTDPKAIYLSMPLTETDQQTMQASHALLELVIDAAGKVHSAQIVNDAHLGPTGDALIKASANWNFIPALKGERPVACKMRMMVSTQR